MLMPAIIRFDDLHQRYLRGEALSDEEKRELVTLAREVKRDFPTGETEIMRALREAAEAEDCAIEAREKAQAILGRVGEAAAGVLATVVVTGLLEVGKR